MAASGEKKIIESINMDQLEELEYAIFLNCKRSYVSIAEYGYLANIYTSLLESPEGLRRLWRIIDEMGRHPDPLVKVILLMQLPRLALVGRAEDRPYCTQWRLLLEYLVDEDEKIRKSSQLVFLFIMRERLLDQDVVKDYCCPAVKQACEIFTDTIEKSGHYLNQLRLSVKVLITGLLGMRREIFAGCASSINGIYIWLQTDQLICQMAPLVGEELTRKYFLHHFIRLCSHEDSSIRESCARNFWAMCIAAGRNTADSVLLPLFVKLCHDPSVHVRSVCTYVFVFVASLSRMEKKRNELTSALSSLLLDTSDICRSSAYRVLGPFMCTFAEHALLELLANDRFFDEYGIYSQNVGSKFSHLQLLKKENPCEIFSRAYVEELFPSFSTPFFPNSPIIRGGGENFRSPSGILFPVLDDCKLFGEQFEELTNSESKHSLLEGCAVDSRNEERYLGVPEESDEFNSFRFWQIPPLEIDCLQETGKENVLAGPYEKIWSRLEGTEDSTESNIEILELHGSVLLNAKNSDSNWNNTQELTDTVHRCMSFVLTSDSESPTFCDAVEPEIFNQLERLPIPSQDVVPEILLAHFIAMANQSQIKRRNISYEEKAQFCARWLPAVALTLGPNNWPRIRDTLRCLSLNFNLKVRKTVASSLHELASILGEEIAARDLIPIFLDFAADSDDVAICAIQHLAEFFKHLVPEKRLCLLSHLVGLVEDSPEDLVSIWNGRCREEIIEQLKFSIKLFTPFDYYKYFVPLAMNLLCSRVASVRYKAVELMSDLILNVKEESNFESCLINKLIKEFASHLSWRRRQMFALLCSHIANTKVLDSEIFSKLFLDHLIKLSKDLVPNVVLCTARCLSISVIKSQYISRSSAHFQDVMNVLKELEKDTDRDVRYFASLYSENDHEAGFLS